MIKVLVFGYSETANLWLNKKKTCAPRGAQCSVVVENQQTYERHVARTTLKALVLLWLMLLTTYQTHHTKTV